VAANGDPQAERFDGQSADHEGRPRCGCGEEDECGDREKESGWHDQQSGVSHGLSFFGPLHGGEGLPRGVRFRIRMSFAEQPAVTAE
jgi:hypothetical protein